MTTPVRDISTAEFPTAVIERSKTVPVVVDFWAAWCGPCRVLGPTLERLAAEAEGSWELVKVDVDANQALAGQFGIQGIPTVIGFRDGAPVDRFTGALPEAAIRTWLDKLIPSKLDQLTSEAGAAYRSGDVERAVAIWRSVLEEDPRHQAAGTALAEHLLDTGEVEEALAILNRLSPTEPVNHLLARARLASAAGDLDELAARAAGGDLGAGLEYGKALAAAGRHPEALEVLLGIVAARDDEFSDQARQAMLDEFEVLGDDPLVGEYRKKLANTLF